MLTHDPAHDGRRYLDDAEHLRRCAHARHWCGDVLIKGADALRAAVLQGLAPVRGVLLDGEALTVRTARFGAPLAITTILYDLDEAADEARRLPVGDDGRLVRETLPRVKPRRVADGTDGLTTIQRNRRREADDAESARVLVRSRFGSGA